MYLKIYVSPAVLTIKGTNLRKTYLYNLYTIVNSLVLSYCKEVGKKDIISLSIQSSYNDMILNFKILLRRHIKKDLEMHLFILIQHYKSQQKLFQNNF